MVRIDVTLVCVFLPLILGAPVDENLKQQITSGLFRNDGYWNMAQPDDSDDGGYFDNEPFEVHTRGIDSLGGGRILRRSFGGDLDGAGEWGNGKSSWRFGGSDRISGARPLRSRLDSLAGQTFGAQKRFDSLSGSTFGNQKRNFDEIDRAGFGSFVKKNFDEIDRVGFGFNKRNFDEIDRTGFGSFVKRAA